MVHLCHAKQFVYSELIIPSLIFTDGAFLCLRFSMDAAMCDLSNAEILNRWKQCHSSGRKQAADYWYDFMAKRVQCGRKGSQRVLSEMDAIGNK